MGSFVHWFIGMLGFTGVQPNLRAIFLKRITHYAHAALLGLWVGQDARPTDVGLKSL